MVGMTLLVAGALVGLDAPPAVRPDEFGAWFEAAREGTLAVPDGVAEAARRLRYIFVAGFAHEQIPGYFAQNTKDLRALGVPKGSIHAIFPSSEETVEESAEAFRRAVFTAASAGTEPLVIVAHSRGACDALAFALTEPAFIRDHVAAIFLVQGAFGGSALADYVVGEGHPIDAKMPAQYRTFAQVVGEVERALVKNGPHGGLPGLTRAESRAYWGRMLRRHAGAIPDLRPRVYFLRSATEPARLGRFRTAIGAYLTAYDGPNDGIVALDDQHLPGLGTTLGVVACGHGDLTCDLRPGAEARKLRRALMPSVVMAVGRPVPGPGAPEDDRVVRAGAAGVVR
jgi:pimeloyl-ACP methyl ester carboxylesterase